MILPISIAVFVLLMAAVQVILSKRRAAAMAPQADALAETWAAPSQPFELAIPASGATDLILTMHAEKSGSWGLAVELEGERPPPASSQGYRGGGETFKLAIQVYAGSATPKTKNGFARVDGDVIDSLLMKTKASVKVRLTRLPPGEAFVIRGKVELNARTYASSVWIAAEAA